MSDRLPTLISATKTLAQTPRWIKHHDDQFRCVVPLDVDSVTEMGLRLRAQCRCEHPDQNVTFQIEYRFKGFSFVPVTRLDWRPINPHQNSNIGPAEWRLMLIEGSHLHPFRDNFDWMLDAGLSPTEFAKKKLPIAVALEHDPKAVEGVAVEVGRFFNIAEMAAFPVPPWEPRLL